MAMGDRPEVKTAPAPIVALDLGLLAGQLATALARVPFRHPLAGNSSLASNLAASVTRDTIRAFMGYSSSLRIPEFRSLELAVDNVCKVIMPPLVRTLEVESHSVEYGGVPGILYVRRQTRPAGLILYMHGGGYIGTAPNMYAFFTAGLCHDTECAVFVADYRLAPEFPYPAGAEDAAAAYCDIIDRGVPAERIFLAGDSGGGGLANTIILECPTHDPIRPAGLILFSPEVDLQLDDPSMTENADRDILPWNIPTAAYLHGTDSNSPAVSPLTADLSHFPPTCVIWGGNEMFRDPIRRYVDRLRSAGVPTEAEEFPGMFHVFPIVMPWAVASRAALSLVLSFIHKIIADAPVLPDAASRCLLSGP
jgi:epsilon-lactone hydrolase